MNQTFVPIEYSCNDNCISCPVPMRRNIENMQFKNIKKEIDNILQTSKHIEFNGGEPTLRKDLLKILKYAEKKNPDEIKLLTNSQFFFYEKYAREIAKIKHLKIITTLYGPNEKIHDAITRTPNSFKHKIRGIKNLIKNNVHIELRILLHKMNYKYFGRIADFLIKNFTPKDFDRIIILNPKLTEQAEKNKKVVAEKLNIIAKFLEKPIKRLDNAGYLVELYHFPYCVLSETLWEYCKGVTADASEIAFTPQCNSCFKKEKCSRIWESYLKIFGSEEFQPITENKKNIYLEITKRCNERCLFCVKSPSYFNEENPSLKDLKKVITEIKTPNKTTLVFDGGEPTLSKHLFPLISFAKKKNIQKINILTNGICLADEKFANKIKENIRRGIKISFSVSLHSHIKEISEKLTNSKDTFEKTIKALKNLNARDIPFGVYTVINSYNVSSLSELVKFVSNLQTKSVTFAYVWHSGHDSIARKNKYLFFKISDYKNEIKQAMGLARKNNLQIKWAGCGVIPFCLAEGFEDILLKSIEQGMDGNYVVNGEGMNKYKLLSNQYALQEKYKKKKCSLCKYDNICQGIWKFYVNLFGDGELCSIQN